MWVPTWTEQFDSLLDRYRGTVVAAFSGHTHVDDFRLLSAADPPFVLITPAISPIYNQNPSFRTVTFASDGSLENSSVYYLTNLLFASSSTAGEWRREYVFTEQWKLPRIDGTTLSSLSTRIRNQESARNEWLKLYDVSSSAAFILPGTAPGFYCAGDELTPEAFAACYCPAPASQATTTKQ